MRAQKYNVEMDDAEWAKTKVDLMIVERQMAMLDELISRYPMRAEIILMRKYRATGDRDEAFLKVLTPD